MDELGLKPSYDSSLYIADGIVLTLEGKQYEVVNTSTHFHKIWEPEFDEGIVNTGEWSVIDFNFAVYITVRPVA